MTDDGNNPGTTDRTASLVAALSEDLELEFRSIIQFVQHIACVTGAEYASTIDELKVHLGQELEHASVLAEQIAFLGGSPATTAAEVPPFTDSRQALEADLSLETDQLERYRRRVEEAAEAGLPDVAEALRPLLTQTQEHVRDLQTALGR